MFGAAAVRNKKRKQAKEAGAKGADANRGPYIKPFGPRFDPSELPYFKYKRALAEAKELQQNISRAKKARVAQQQQQQNHGAARMEAQGAAAAAALPGVGVDGLKAVAAASGGKLKVKNKIKKK